MSTFVNQRFPQYLSVKATGGDEFETAIISLENGNEQRISVLSQPKASWTFNDAQALNNEHEKLAFQNLRNLYYVARGKLYSFRYRDYFEFQANKTEGILGNGFGDGTPHFQVFKRYTVSNKKFDRIIKLPTQETFNLYVNDVKNEAYSLNPIGGIVTLAPIKSFSIFSTSIEAFTTTFTFTVNHNFQIGEKVYLNITNKNSNLYRKVCTVLSVTQKTVTIDTKTLVTIGTGKLELYYSSTDKLNASFEFDFLVRFDSDKLSKNFDSGLVRLNELSLKEVTDDITEVI